MLTSIADEATVMECLEKGAAGCLRKDSPIEDISRLLTEFRKEAAVQPNPGETMTNTAPAPYNLDQVLAEIAEDQKVDRET